MPAPVQEQQILCPIERLRAWQDQPRTQIDDAGLDELADSMRQHGVIEPLIVRRVGADFYEIICGERRWRAAQRAGILEVPVIVRQLDDDTAFEHAVSENLSRSSLTLADTATACLRLASQGLNGVAIAKRFGCSAQLVSEALAVGVLPPQVLQLNREGQLSNRHLRILRNVKDPKKALAIAEQTVREHLTPTTLAHTLLRGHKPAARKPAGVRDLELRFERKLGMRCQVVHSKDKFASVTLSGTLDQLDDLIEKLDV